MRLNIRYDFSITLTSYNPAKANIYKKDQHVRFPFSQQIIDTIYKISASILGRLGLLSTHTYRDRDDPMADHLFEVMVAQVIQMFIY